MIDENINKDDKKIIDGCIKGNPTAQEKLFKKYYGLMLGICLRYAGNRNDAKDILQEGFVKIFANVHKFKFEGSFRGWMKRIMVNTAIDKYRKKVSEPNSVEINENLDVIYSENILSTLNKEDILKCINDLPTGYRTIFNLYAIEGYSHKEIAVKLGVSEGTSKSQLFKAKQQLKMVLSNLYPEHE